MTNVVFRIVAEKKAMHIQMHNQVNKYEKQSICYKVTD